MYVILFQAEEGRRIIFPQIVYPVVRVGRFAQTANQLRFNA